MRVALLGWCASTSLYVEALERAGARPLLAVTGAEAPAAPALAAVCARFGVPLERRNQVNDADFVLDLAQRGVELLLVTGWPRVLGERLRQAPKYGCINVHPSLLPAYRGKDPLFWAILRGERTVGVTLHRMTEVIDGGPILLQRALEVPAGATTVSLSVAVDREGAALIPELVERARAGTLGGGTLPDAPGSYFPPVREEHALLDWTAPADALERLVRACTGVARAHCFFGGMKLVALDARVIDARRAAAPGTVLAIEDAIEIATASAALAVSRWLFVERVHDASELAARVALREGARLSHNPALT